jgi:hypothetical protein
MRILASILLAVVCIALPVVARGQAAPQSSSQKSSTQVRAEDGGVSEMMESIVVSAKAQAPFTLLLETEWVRTLADGGTITLTRRAIQEASYGRFCKGSPRFAGSRASN